MRVFCSGAIDHPTAKSHSRRGDIAATVPGVLPVIPSEELVQEPVGSHQKWRHRQYQKSRAASLDWPQCTSRVENDAPGHPGGSDAHHRLSVSK